MVIKWNAIQLTVAPLKGTVLYANVSILLWTTLAVPKISILTPKRYDEHPSLFYMCVPPGEGVDHDQVYLRKVCQLWTVEFLAQNQ